MHSEYLEKNKIQMYVIITPALSGLNSKEFTKRYTAKVRLEASLFQVYLLCMLVGQYLHLHFGVNIKIT